MVKFFQDPLPNHYRHWDIWKEFRHKGENLYLIEIPHDEFHYSDNEQIKRYITDYYTKGLYYRGDAVKRNYETNWQFDFESYLKTVWLAEEYYFDRLRYPVGAHYNPVLGKIVMHPGNARNFIYRLFHKKPILSVFFNTGGIKFEWLDKSKIINLNKLNQLYDEVYFVVSAEHGSLVPHVHFNTGIIDPSIIQCHETINYYLSYGRMNTNLPFWNEMQILPFLGPQTMSIRPAVEFFFTEDATEDDQIRALMLWPLPFKKIEDEKFTIIKKHVRPSLES